MTTLYDILGASPSDPPAVLKRKYRKAAQRAHPDKGGNAALFQEVEKAGRILLDEQRKLKYDQSGDTGDEMTDEQQAAFVLKMIFIQCLNRSFETQEDPVRLCRNEIVKGQQEGPRQVAAQGRKISRLEKALAKNLKGRKDSPPHLESAISMQIFIERMKLQQMELAMRIGPIMLQMLKCYSWEVEFTEQSGKGFGALEQYIIFTNRG